MGRFGNWSTLVGLPVALVLMVSAFSHVDNEYRFLSAIYSYKIVGTDTGLLLAALLPFLQLVLSLAILFFPSIRKVAFAACSALFLGFAAIQIFTLYRGLNISCGCFGSHADNPIGARSISIAACGSALSLAGWYCERAKGKMNFLPGEDV